MIKIEQSSKKVSSGLFKKSAMSLKKLKNRKDLGFLNLPFNKSLIESVKKRVKEALKSSDRMIVLGIGGSSLGGIVLKNFMLDSSKLEFFENVDGEAFIKKISALKDIQKIHWVLISKSGKTIETLTQINFVSQYFEKLGIKFTENCTVISETRSNPLSDFARKHHIPVLEIPLDVGGRFSVLSPVGLFPAAYLGMDIDLLLKGASWALKQDRIVTELVAQSLASWQRKEWITVFWVYSEPLQKFGFWWAQLWAESLAKKKNRKNKKAARVSTPMPLVGANDQHSVLQQVMEGYRDKFVWFLKVNKESAAGLKLNKSLFKETDILLGKTMNDLFEAETLATQETLDKNKVPTLVLGIESLSVECLGALFMLMQLVVGALGEALDINAFDQPGVEEGKKRAVEKLISLDKK